MRHFCTPGVIHQGFLRGLPPCQSAESNATAGCGSGRCDNTGFYQEPDELVYAAFRFKIGGQLLSWGQPQRWVDWPVQFSTGSDIWNHEPGQEKPIELRPRQFAAAKALGW